jgi:1-deoxy-D-xylulose-5-phosphate reductoisomerase
MVSVSVMGATGSIGSQTLDIVRSSDGHFDVQALSVGSSVDGLLPLVDEFQPEVVVVADATRHDEAVTKIDSSVRVLSGDDGLREASATADIVINGVMGFAGLAVTLSALEHGKRLGLANKESLIAAGPLVQVARATPGAELLPVDSEHCALHQCLRASHDGRGVDRLVLTASGGPFRGRTQAELATVTIENALAHPTWSMGPKITIDSSTLMNKGLEVIEAHELYGVPYDQIDVVVHPQSIVHSMVAYSDGSTIAQLSQPDMRLCIAYSLAYPDRYSEPFGAMDWTESLSLDFEPPDRHAFRCLDLAYEAGRLGGTAPAWLSAANEVCVEAFLEGLMPWTGIAETNEELMEEHDGAPADSLEAVLEADSRARERTWSRIRETL